MNTQDLLARAAKIKERNKLLESVPGSGYHDNDRDFRGRYMAPHKQHLPGGMNEGYPPLPRIGDHLVAFYGRRDVLFVGEDAERALAAIRGYARQYLERVEADPQYIAALTGTQRKLCYDILPRLAIVDGVLEVWLTDWNDVLHAFDDQVIGTSGAPLKPDGSTP